MTDDNIVRLSEAVMQHISKSVFGLFWPERFIFDETSSTRERQALLDEILSIAAMHDRAERYIQRSIMTGRWKIDSERRM